MSIKNPRYIIKQFEKRKYGNNDFRNIGTYILGRDVIELYELEKVEVYQLNQ